jgi:hypothetical protein
MRLVLGLTVAGLQEVLDERITLVRSPRDIRAALPLPF